MSIKLEFDGKNYPSQPLVILAKRNGQKLGLLQINNVIVKNSMTDGSEISFKVYKEINGKKTNLWDEIKDFRLIWCKEFNEWYEITIETSESDETVKSVSGVNLARAELSQTMLYGIDTSVERNYLLTGETEAKETVFYDEKNPEYSLLHRILDKAPHYRIAHVDESLLEVNQYDTSLEFTFDGTDIVSAFNEVAERVGCLFVYNTNSANDKEGLGVIDRSIYVYDLQRKCNSCHKRNEHYNECPYCGSTDLTKGYGEDTNIFITSDELTEEITFTSDTGSMKNCFKLEAGDDIINSAIVLSNPSGSDYIWYLNEDTRKDMSEELQQRLKEYDETIDYYNKQKEYRFENYEQYNELVRKYNSYRIDYDINNNIIQDNSFSLIKSVEVGYPTIARLKWETIDFEQFLNKELMPKVEFNQTNAQKEANNLVSNMSSVAFENFQSSVKDIKIVSNAVLDMAKAIVDNRYEVTIVSEENSGLGKIIQLDATWWWSGQLEIKNSNYPEDKVVIDDYLLNKTNYTGGLLLKGDYLTFVKEKIDKMLTKNYNNDYSITGIFKKLPKNGYDEETQKYPDSEEEPFKTEMGRYSVEELNVFLKCCTSALDILISQHCSDKKDTYGVKNTNYYDIYLPYLRGKQLILDSINIRESELEIVTDIQKKIDEEIKKTNSILDMQEFLKTEEEKNQKDLEYGKLGIELLHFRREDKFSNDNFKSDTLSVAKQFERAQEFIEYAKREIYKSSELQHSISSTLKNLLIIDKFKPLVKNFKLGNWLRVQIDRNSDDQLPYKLRLINYEIDYDNLDDINVEFSDVVKSEYGISGQKSIMDKLSSISSSYSAVSKNATDGKKAEVQVKDWISEGLNTNVTKIVNNANGQVQTWDDTGMLFQRYDDITETYDGEKLKVLNSSIVMTSDDWRNVKTAIGKMYYINPETGVAELGYGINAEMLIGRMILGETMKLYSQNGGLTFDEKGLVLTSKYAEIILDPDITGKNNRNGVFVINQVNGTKTTPVFIVDENGNLTVNGSINAINLDLTNAQTIEGADRLIDSTGFISVDGTIGDTPTDGSTGFVVSSSGLLEASNAIIYGTVYSSAGVIGGWSIGNNTIQHKGSDNTYVGVGTNTNAVFYAGGINSDGTDGKFRVMHDGTMHSTKANIEGNIVAEVIKAKEKYQIFSEDSSNPITVIDYTNTNSSNQTFKFGRLSANSYNSKNDIEFVDNGLTRQAIINTDEFIVNAPVDVSNGGIYLYGNSIKGTSGCVNALAVGGDNGFYFGANSAGGGYSNLTVLRGATVRLYATSSGGGVYLGSTGSTAVTSDEKLKDISEMDDRYIDFFNKIEPVAYKYKTGHRTHLGFGARAVEQALIDSDLTTEDFAGVLIDKNPQLGEDEVIVPEGEEIPDELYSLRYEEFIALNTKVLQQALKRIDVLEEEVKSLKKQLESR